MRTILFFLIIFGCSIGAQAEFLVSLERGQEGTAVILPGAVIWAIPKDKNVLELIPRVAHMEQLNRQFKPFILAVQQGAEVTFPNRDRTSHHVYSFSKPITFELPLYKKSTPKPIVFDKPGLVPLGCNIHDWMIAYIMVLETPFFGQLEQSELKLASVPEGEYELKLWHPAIDSRESLSQTVQYSGDEHYTFKLKFPLKTVPQPLAPTIYADEVEDY